MSLALPRFTVAPVLADRLLARSRVTDVALVMVGAFVVAALAQVEIPLWPVPVTGQTLAVLLVGTALGAARGASAIVVYTLAGLAGAPVFAGFTGGLLALTKPSFGFVLGFIAAAALVGWLAERRWDRKPFSALVALLAGTVVPFAFGLPWLAVSLAALGLPSDLNAVLVAGVYPFIIGGVVKWLIAAALLPLAWKLLNVRKP
ncbi:biotin transport system substrate-specific component [Agreia bicolorata]|uniref:Biotin transporter n=1 Tax=Agreia bicolorata TaxID=110935 RepID=A0A1T4WQB1_9MICO|nr:biotin transporter BioY [Agreia bicolorata]SKA79449.1 biotin transport system substrate-specific component [Agreia bicolorata]